MINSRYKDTSLNFIQKSDVEKLLTKTKGDKLVIPEQIDGMIVEGVATEAFDGIIGIKEIVFPDSLVHMSTNAMKNCDFERLIFGKKLENFHIYGLWTNKRLNCIEIDAECPYYRIVDGNLYGANGISLYYGINNTIAEGTARIEKNAFSNSDISSIIIPDSVTHICHGAFSKCRNLKNIEFKGQNLREIDDYSFSMCKKLKCIKIPGSVFSIGDFAFKGAGLSELEFEDRGEKNIKLSIGRKAFVGTALNIVDFSNIKSLSVNFEAFSYTKVTNLTLSGLINLQPHAFYQCNIESITLKSIIIEHLSISQEALGVNTIGLVRLLEKLNNENIEASYVLHKNEWIEDRFW